MARPLGGFLLASIPVIADVSSRPIMTIPLDIIVDTDHTLPYLKIKHIGVMRETAKGLRSMWMNLRNEDCRVVLLMRGMTRPSST